MTKKSYSKPEIVMWAGSDSAFDLYLNSHQLALDAGYLKPGAELEARASCDSCEDPNSLLTVQDGIGIIQISGVLTNKEAWYNRFLGLVSYQRIEEAMYEATIDPAVVETLVLNDSPGGAVPGVTDAVDAIKKAASAKPMTVYSGSIMASGGMFLAAPAQKRFVGPLTVVGSIGVVAKHVEMSKMMQEIGITETVVRAGEFKQLANQSEPLSEKAKATIQEAVDHTYGVFVQMVADFLGKSYQVVDTKMAQGREFTGSQAVDVGLVHGVATFDEVYTAIHKRVAKKNNAQGGGTMAKKTVMTKALLEAAAAAGVDLESFGVSTQVNSAGDAEGADGAGDAGVTGASEDGASEDGGTTEQSAEGSTPEQGEQSGDESGTSQSTQAAEGDTTPTALDLMKEQLGDKDDQIFALKTELQGFKADAEAVEGLKKIVAGSVNVMVVASGGSESDLSALSAAELVERHTAATPDFLKAFPVGGAASTEPEGDEEGAGQQANASAVSHSVKAHKAALRMVPGRARRGQA